MKRLALGFAWIALAACQSGGSAAPGDGAGATDPRFTLPADFSEGTTLDDLKTRYGPENVKLTTEPGYDGSPSPLVLLFPEDPTRRAEVRFHSDSEDPLGLLASITVTEPVSIWRGKHGVRIGMSLAELRAKNGRAFYFTGFDEAGRGQVRDAWDVGALDVVEGDRLYFGVDLRLRDGAPSGAYPSEGMWSTDDPLYPQLGELVEVSGFSAWSSLDDEWSRAPERCVSSSCASRLAAAR
jgi:hypothetical protein